ncbi:hypothetical protein CAEBREN_13930 [Caenorhabditis brenneri]|uniref:Homeobox domain-containing protein n=1 Tax=Caenorhabditis brenneri TaxID=135651 RepID=G0P069_CAEBE|nr:hypothetical protein CAEBREN_13930 [Caenorhabditis brenneri]
MEKQVPLSDKVLQEHLQYLETRFNISQTMPQAEAQILGEHIGLQPKLIYQWFRKHQRKRTTKFPAYEKPSEDILRMLSKISEEARPYKILKMSNIQKRELEKLYLSEERNSLEAQKEVGLRINLPIRKIQIWLRNLEKSGSRGRQRLTKAIGPRPESGLRTATDSNIPPNQLVNTAQVPIGDSLPMQNVLNNTPTVSQHHQNYSNNIPKNDIKKWMSNPKAWNQDRKKQIINLKLLETRFRIDSKISLRECDFISEITELEDGFVWQWFNKRRSTPQKTDVLHKEDPEASRIQQILKTVATKVLALETEAITETHREELEKLFLESEELREGEVSKMLQLSEYRIKRWWHSRYILEKVDKIGDELKKFTEESSNIQQPTLEDINRFDIEGTSDQGVYGLKTIAPNNWAPRKKVPRSDIYQKRFPPSAESQPLDDDLITDSFEIPKTPGTTSSNFLSVPLLTNPDDYAFPLPTVPTQNISIDSEQLLNARFHKSPLMTGMERDLLGDIIQKDGIYVRNWLYRKKRHVKKGKPILQPASNPMIQKILEEVEKKMKDHKKRYFTSSQNKILEEVFRSGTELDHKEKAALAKSLEVPLHRITYWFINRRRKQRMEEAMEESDNSDFSGNKSIAKESEISETVGENSKMYGTSALFDRNSDSDADLQVSRIHFSQPNNLDLHSNIDPNQVQLFNYQQADVPYITQPHGSMDSGFYPAPQGFEYPSYESFDNQLERTPQHSAWNWEPTHLVFTEPSSVADHQMYTEAYYQPPNFDTTDQFSKSYFQL